MCSVAGFSTLLANETTVGNFCKTNPTALKYVGGLIGARSTLYLVVAVLKPLALEALLSAEG